MKIKTIKKADLKFYNGEKKIYKIFETTEKSEEYRKQFEYDNVISIHKEISINQSKEFIITTYNEFFDIFSGFEVRNKFIKGVSLKNRRFHEKIQNNYIRLFIDIESLYIN